MKICYFGAFIPNYARNRVIIKGLELNGVEVVQCNDLSPSYPKRYYNLYKKHKGLNYDVMIIGVTYGQPIIPLSKILTKKPIILDLFLGLYETLVIDSKKVKEESIYAKFLYSLDKYAPKLANHILTDTKAHKSYFVSEYGLNVDKISEIFVGTDDSLFYPREKTSDKRFQVLFWGGYIPLHGIDTIIQAAKYLEVHEDIIFKLVGDGQTFVENYILSKKLSLKNIVFQKKWIPYNDLPNLISQSDVCLGIFGNTEKAFRVIPNKVYEALAMRKPVITMESPAAKELLINRENSILIPCSDAQQLANAILLLKNNELLRKKIASQGYNTYVSRATPTIIGEKVKALCSLML